VLKAEGVDHKSDEGLVRLGVSSAKEVRAAFAELSSRTGRVLVAEHISGGTECVIGVSHDELFGPVIMFGLGGVFIEVFRDVTFRVPPFDKDEARRMIDEVQGAALLKGARGRPKGDIKALVDTIMKVQKLAVDNADQLAELDINPLVVLPKGVVALDALAVAWRSGKRGAATSRPWSQVPDRVRGQHQWTRPFGLLRPVDEIAMLTRRYLHEYGGTREQLASVAVSVRTHANRNPGAMMQAKTLTIEQYLDARWISEPLCLYDNCLESDGAGAVVITTTERARDCPTTPVLVHGFAQSIPQQHQTMTNYFCDDPL